MMVHPTLLIHKELDRRRESFASRYWALLAISDTNPVNRNAALSVAYESRQERTTFPRVSHCHVRIGGQCTRY